MKRIGSRGRTLAAALCVLAAARAGAQSLDQEAERLLAAGDAERVRLLDALPGDLAPVTQELLAQGDEARAGARFPRAVAAYAAAGALARRAGDDRALGRALAGESDAWFRQGQLDRATALAEDALVLYDAYDDANGLAQAWNALGNVRWTQGRMQDALELYERAQGLFERSGDRLGLGRVHNNLGEVNRNTGDTDAALDHFQQARAIFAELGDARRASVVIDNIGIVHFWRGEYAAAEQNVREALAMREAAGDRYGVGKSLDSLGNVHLGQGAYARALECFHRALPLRRETRDYHGVVETSHNLGLVYTAQGDHARAIDAFKRGLRLNASLGDASFEAEALRNVGAAAWALGQRGRAEANLRAALRIAEREDLGFMTGEIVSDLGEIALAGGRTREAKRLLERALEVRARAKDRKGRAMTLTLLARAALAEGRAAEAASLASEAAGIARAYDQPDPLWEALTVEGVAARRQGRADEARRAQESAVAVVEALRFEAGGTGERRAGFLGERLSPYHELVALAVARGDAAAALAAAERAKARVLADLMGRRPDLARALTADERVEERRLRGALLARNARLARERQADAPEAARVAALVAERDGARAAYEGFEEAALAAHPERGRMRAALPPFALPQADALLADAATALVEYVVAPDRAYAFVVTRDDGRPSVTAHVLDVRASDLAAAVERFRAAVAARSLAFRDDGRRLDALLLRPLAARLAGRTRLVLVPDGVLWNLPFQALPGPDGRYLVESASVAYAPSLAVLRAIGRRESRTPSLLALGRSGFGDEQVRRIAPLYAEAAVHTGDDAREDRFKSEADRYSVLHLAAHGVLDEASPLYSHIALAPGASEDGALEARELLEMRLHADVVVLSACDTGRGRIAPGEGVVGTQWALFVAGARTLVVSQWPVESASTTALMTAFHRGLASGTGAPAEHLRAASLALLRDPRSAHPFYWAGFVLVGDPS